MVQATRTINISTKRELVNVLFDKNLKIPAVERICKNAAQARAFIESQYARAIREALLKFTKQQLYIANNYPAMEGAEKKINSANMIIDAITDTYGKPLVVLTSSVYWLRGEIYNLQPKESSRYRKNYDTVIAPLIDLCFNHSRKQRLRMLYVCDNVPSDRHNNSTGKREAGGTTVLVNYAGNSIPHTHLRI